jgi:threonine dehydrogenase-like Zn-dependent dehydrogenase
MKIGLVNPSTYITHQLSFDEVKEKFSSLLDPANAVIKAMIGFS